MCLIAFAIGASQRLPLVIAANRDEFLNRPTLQLDRWQTACGQEIISGRDLRAGGTWLGITPGGRVAFLTNVREATPQAFPFSRGELVTRWLEGSMDAKTFAALLEKDKHYYGGFNLVLGDVPRNAWSWLTNRPAERAALWHMQSLPPGIYGLSNAALDTPWPKTVALKKALTAAMHLETRLDAIGDAWQTPLWAALGNQEIIPSLSLHENEFFQAFDSALSSAFVDIPERGYGTRSSTVLVVRKLEQASAASFSRVDVTERTHTRLLGDKAFAECFSSFDFPLELS